MLKAYFHATKPKKASTGYLTEENIAAILCDLSMIPAILADLDLF
jgi:hypothetical protein